MSTKFIDADSELDSIYKEAYRRRIRLGHPTEYTPKPRKNTRFGSDIHFIIGLCGILPYRVK